MPSSMLKSNQNIISNKTPPGLLFVWTVTVVSDQPWSVLVGGGGSKLYHSVWEPPIMYLAWKIPRSLGCYVDNESIPLKILFISVLKLELWHLCKSLLPFVKGLSIYFYC